MFLRIFLVVLFLLIFSSLSYSAYNLESVPEYELSVSIDVENNLISGIANISVISKKEVSINVGDLLIEEITLNGKEIFFDPQKVIINFLPESDGILSIKYEGIFTEKDKEKLDNVIDRNGIMLTGVWYPKIDDLFRYKLTVILPAGYEAISESENIDKRLKNGMTEFVFHFPYPVDDINLVASNKYKTIKEKFNDIEIFLYFFEENLPLANQYLEFTKKYIRLYEGLIGNFPYKRFSIVENFLPTGYSMPTFILLGSDVIRLPFILETSLGHEILHQWFGNSVYIDYKKGNWAEGLTTYLADHFYAEQKNKGNEYRKQLLIDYISYVNEEKEFPLKDFKGRFDFTSKAIGYGKAAMVFHMIKKLIGEDAFNKSIKDIVDQKRFQKISWDDIKNIFSFNYFFYKSIKEFKEKGNEQKTSWKDLQLSFKDNLKENLDWFFSQWVNEKGIAEIFIKDAKVKQNGSMFNVNFTILQGQKSFILDIPLTIYFLNGQKKKEWYRIDRQKNDITLSFDYEPEKIVIDEDYDIFRRLSIDETPPVISTLIGEQGIIIVPSENKEIYSDVIDYFIEQGAEKKINLKDSDIKDSSILIIGNNNIIKRLFGKINKIDGDFSLVVKKNPWNTKKVIAFLNAKSKEDVNSTFKKIFHYGNYSEIVFEKGKNVSKRVDLSENGIKAVLMEEPTIIDTRSLKRLDDVINAVLDKRIIYIGEFHDRFAHHNLQLQIIKGIYERYKKIAIGMEMFQRPFQDVLDDYISDRLDEREFLKQSEYFKRWGFDYNLYKPILDFSKKEKIPVIALNIEREIIDKVSKRGLESLSEQEMKKIPEEIDFSDSDYKERLISVFRMHDRGEDRNFDFFYQSQLLWDETMAESIDNFLRKNEDYKIIVLAGGGHIAYGSGIPKRLYRRNNFPYATIMIDSNVDREIADFVIYPRTLEGVTAPKLMAFLSEENGLIKVVGFPENSISERAGMKKGDILLSIDDMAIRNMEDIRIHLFYKRSGDKIKVKVLRKRFLFGDKEIDIDITL
jgi:uncharacterized iron-regulated protein